MKIFVADTYEAISKQAADDMVQLLNSIEKPLICTASGDSPAGLYKEIVGRVREKKLDIASWSFISLDEWVGMNGSHEGSCRYHLDRQLFQALHLTEERISFFDGHTNDLEKECQQAESFIKEHGGIDVAILGLGMNGHIGMNEPGTSSSSRSHVAELDPVTQKVGQKYFKEKQALSHGITLGIANLMEAHHIFLLVSGAKKAKIVKRVLEEEISEKLPASLLRKHPGLKIYLDAEAARDLPVDKLIMENGE